MIVALLDRLVRVLPLHRYRFADEKQLQDGIAQVLQDHGIWFEREHIDGTDRFDFYLGDGVVIETKIKGGIGEAVDQCGRYLAKPSVSAVVLVASTQWAMRNRGAPADVHGKPLRYVYLRPQAF